jgi:NAD(P) transhydrogenase subunit alpha
MEEGHDVCVATGAGKGSNWSDADYRGVGCEVVNDH